MAHLTVWDTTTAPSAARTAETCEHHAGGVCLLSGGPAPASMCRHCLSDATGLFRARLEANHARRTLKERLAAGGEHFTCHRYGGIEVDEEFCRQCRSNAALRQLLGSTHERERRFREPCIYRGAEDGVEEITCCGGRTKEVTCYRCSRRRRTHRYKCLSCSSYRPRDPGEGSSACVSWPALWQAHRGAVILVLGCGPSVLLPGEAPGPDTVDPRQVEHEVCISSNWAWKWYPGICDYQLSYDVTPCQGWRPPGVKLLTVVRNRETMKLIDACRPYCTFPAIDYGDIAQGRPLPCSRNSGLGALSLAAYMGAAHIKVLGMDFRSRDGRMHFYPETQFDVDRREKSYGRNETRVQEDLRKLLAQVRGMGITVENLSPISVLDWS